MLENFLYTIYFARRAGSWLFRRATRVPTAPSQLTP